MKWQGTIRVLFFAIVGAVPLLFYLFFLVHRSEEDQEENEQHSGDTVGLAFGQGEKPDSLLVLSESVRVVEGAPVRPGSNLTRSEVLRMLEKDGLALTWKRLEGVDDETVRFFLQREVLAKMSRDGYALKALEFVKQNVGLGIHREKFVYEVVSRSDLALPSVIALHQQSTKKVDQLGFKKGLDFLVMRKGLGTLTAVEIPEEFKESIAGSLGVYFNQRGAASEVLESLRSLSQGAPEAESMMQGFLRNLSPKKLKMLVIREGKIDGEFAESFSRAAHQRLAVVSPEWFLEEIFQGTLKSDPGVVEFASTVLATADPERAARMLEIAPNSEREMRDGMTSGLSSAAANHGDFESAWEWASQISDAGRKKAAEGRVWSAESAAVKGLVGKEPINTLNSITSGQSSHEPYWAKAAFVEWFSRDSDAANQWFSQNSGSFPPENAQHIARAYAEVALGDGNINLARQWAEQVIDPNFKQKLVEQIDAAAGQTE